MPDGAKEFCLTKASAGRGRRVCTPAFKARVAIAALREDKSMAELSKYP
jgi:transposase